MAQMIGADVTELRTLAAQFDGSAQRLRAQASNVGRGIQISAWIGPAAIRFRHTWASEHSVWLKHAAASLEHAAVSLRQNAAEQEAASGSLAARAGRDVVASDRRAEAASPWDLIKGLVGAAGDLLEEVRAKGGDFALGISSIGLEFRKLGEIAHHAPDWMLKGTERSIARLGFITAPLDILDFGTGLAENDHGKVTTGAIGIGSLALPGPLAIASSAALLYGSTVLPTDNQEYDESFQRAMRTQFGSTYDPANPTQRQSEWAMNRYEGPMGVLNSISDGMDSKLSWIGDPAADAGRKFKSWFN